MAFKARTRDWLDAVSGGALQALRDEVDRLAGDVGALRTRTAESEARQQRELAALRGDLQALVDRFETHSGRTYVTADDLAEVARTIEGGSATAEQLRLKLTGLTEQLRWESDDLRKGLAAIIERVERQRKTP